MTFQPAHKDLKTPPGQIVNPIPMSGYRKSDDGCCHKTVLGWCSDCGVIPRVSVPYPVDWYIKRGIAHPPEYPVGEARWATIEDYVVYIEKWNTELLLDAKW